MKLIFAATMLVASSLAVSAHAQAVPGPYVQVNVGGVVKGEAEVYANYVGYGSGTEDWEAEPGIFASVAGGQSLSNGFAVEAELLHTQSDIDTDDVNALVGFPVGASAAATALMLNVIYEVAPIGPFSLGIGAGVGYGQADYEIYGEDFEDYGVTWQAMAGLSYPVSEAMSWEARYRYLRGPEISGTFSDGVNTITLEPQTAVHAVTVGARFKF